MASCNVAFLSSLTFHSSKTDHHDITEVLLKVALNTIKCMRVRTWIFNAKYLIPVNPPPLHGNLPRKSLISRMDWVSCTGDINLLHTPFPPARSPPYKNFPHVKKIKYNKILSWSFLMFNELRSEVNDCCVLLTLVEFLLTITVELSYH